MQLPADLRSAIESSCAGVPRRDLASAAQALSNAYRESERPRRGAPLTALAALAYAATRMPATYAALRRVFAEIGDQEVASVHDIGAGTGAGAWAVREAFGSSVAITCEERDVAMSALGSTLAPFAAWGTGGGGAAADLVLISYVLGETPDFAAFARDAWRLARKFLVIVEPGTPRGFDRIAALRSLGPVVAPCPGWGAQPCPAREAEKDWCHFAARVERTALHRQLKGGELSHEDEKFSYLILAKEQPEGGGSWKRIVRHPFIEPGQIQLQLCDGATMHKTMVRKRSNPDAFRAARKADWGDRWTSGD